MAVAVKTSGSTTTDGTEQTLATVTDPEVLQLTVDVANLVNGDVIELRIYGKARSSDTERLMWGPVRVGPVAPITKLLPGPAMLSPHHFKATIKRIAGTDRAYPWAIYESGA